jgi:release factor glutamine methyltransferase
MITLAQSLKNAQKKLIDTDTAPLDAELLMSSVLACDRSYLFAWPEKLLTSSQENNFEQLIRRRARGEPVAYLIGKKEFWSMMLEVNASTLIPRPETELLVEIALQKLPDTSRRIIDLGTGTGAIALALAKERPQWHITACDRTPEIVELAKRNAESLSLLNVTCVLSNWFDSITQQNFDLVISNPPYIDSSDQHLSQGDLRFEPHTALVADKGGLADIEKISRQAMLFLNKNGWLMLEHGFAQAQQVRNLFKMLDYAEIETICDLASHERVTIGRYVGEGN